MEPLDEKTLRERVAAGIPLILYKHILVWLSKLAECYDQRDSDEYKARLDDTISRFVDTHIKYIQKVHGAEWENYVDLIARLRLSDDTSQAALLKQLRPYRAIGDRFRMVSEEDEMLNGPILHLMAQTANLFPANNLWTALQGRRNWWFKREEVSFYERDPSVWKSRAQVLGDGYSAQVFDSWIRDKGLKGYVMTRSDGLCEVGASQLLQENYAFDGVLFRVKDVNEIIKSVRKYHASEMNPAKKALWKFIPSIRKKRENISTADIIRQFKAQRKGSIKKLGTDKIYSDSMFRQWVTEFDESQ